MQVGRTQPDAVEEGDDIAVERLLHQALALDTHLAHDPIGVDRRLPVPRFQPIAIGAHLRYRHARAGALTGMTVGTLGIEQRLTGLGFRRVDGKGILGAGLLAR